MQISSLVSLTLLSTFASGAIIHSDFAKRKSVDCQKIQVALNEAGAYYRGRLSGYYGQAYVCPLRKTRESSY
jgi:phage gp36-like protein